MTEIYLHFPMRVFTYSLLSLPTTRSKKTSSYVILISLLSLMPDWFASTNGPHRIRMSGFSCAATAISSSSGTYSKESFVVYGPAATIARTPGPGAVLRSVRGRGRPSTMRKTLMAFSPPTEPRICVTIPSTAIIWPGKSE